MTLEQALAFATFTVVAAGTPGPSNALLTATGANVGVVRGLPALLGVSAGMGLMMFAVAFGLGALILEKPAVLAGVKWLGAAVLCWLAWKIATASTAGASGPGGKPVGFVDAAVFQWVNPKSWLVSASAAATFLDREAGGALAQSLGLGLVFVAASAPACFPWLAFGAALQRVLRSERALRLFNVAMALLLVASIALFLA